MSKIRVNEIETLDGLHTKDVAGLIDNLGDSTVTTSTGEQSLVDALDDRASLSGDNTLTGENTFTSPVSVGEPSQGSHAAQFSQTVRKVNLAGLEPERLSATVLRIFPGFCSDGDSVPTDTMEITTSYDIDVTTTGLGGLDTGTFATNDNYFVYMLKNPTTGDVGAVLSTEISTSMVTRPSGYTLIRKLPWGFMSRGGEIPAFHLSYWPLPFTRYTDASEDSAWQVLSAGTATTFTTVDLSAFLPENARLAYIMIRHDRVSAEGKAYVRTGGGGGDGIPVSRVMNTVGDQTYNFLNLRTTSARAISYRVDSGTRLSIYVLGYSQTERS